MGMFEKEKSLTKSVQLGSPFILWNGRFLGTTSHSDYGENVKAEVEVTLDDSLGRETYVVFGVLADQIRRASSDDLPAVVKVEKDGRANTFVFVEKMNG